MGNDGIGAPLSRRVPGEARPGPGQPVRAVLPESVLNRMQAAIDAEHAQVEGRQPGEPNTEPLPRVTGPGAPSKRGAKRAPSPSGAGPDFEPLADQDAKPEGAAKPPRAARSPRAEEPLRVAKALRATEAIRAAEEQRAADELRAAAAARVQAAEPVRTTEPQPERAEPPVEPDWPPKELGAAEPPRVTKPSVTAAFETGPTPGSIGWLWPEETDTRRGGGGGGSRWQPPRRWSGGGGGWRYRTATLVALGAVLLATAGLAIGLSLRSTPTAAAGQSHPKVTAPPLPTAVPTPTAVAASAASGVRGANPNRTAAAAWIGLEVAPGTVVACDVQTCAALSARGFPADQEVSVGIASQSLSPATLVVETPALRTVFTAINPALGDDVAAPVLASFGTGNAQVTVQVIDPAGGAAYQGALSQDVQARMQLGEQLLNSGRVSASPAAGNDLAAGAVDSRLLLAIKALSVKQPVDVLGFADSGPGASAGVPFRAAYLAETDPSAPASGRAYLQTMVGMLKAHANFLALKSATQTTLDGQTVVQIEYAAPSPLGLLTR
jgi:hypothetical protein